MHTLYKPFALPRTVFWAAIPLIFAVFSLLAPACVLAQDTGFTVTDVQVDVTAATAVEAREKAFAQAQQDAFRKLAQTFVSEDGMAAFTVPDVAVIDGMVQDFEVTNERISPVRYIGTYTFRFRESAVRNYFGRQGVSYSEVKSRPVLVLPFYQWGSRTILWEDNNPWLAAWKRSEGADGLVPVMVPVGDLQDIQDLNGGTALTYDPGTLGAMLSRYGAGEAVILIAVPQENPGAISGPPARLDVNLYRTDNAAPQFVTTVSVPGYQGETAAMFYDRAVQAIRRAIQEDWKSKTALAPSAAAPSSLTARVSLTSLQDWIGVQNALRRTPGLNGYRLISLKPREAMIELVFDGDENRLRLKLAQQSIILTMSASGAAMAGTGAPVYDLYFTPAPAPTPVVAPY